MNSGHSAELCGEPYGVRPGQLPHPVLREVGDVEDELRPLGLGKSLGRQVAGDIRALDEGRIDDALEMLDPDVQFVMVLPAGTRRGRGRDEMRAYLVARPVPDRLHVVLRQSRDEEVEFLYGRVTDGGTTTGRFLSGVRVGANGLIASYQVTFDTEHVLVDEA